MLRGALVFVAVGAAGCSLTPGGGDTIDAAIARPPLTAGVGTLAGWAEAGDIDGPRTVNLFHNPVGVAVAADGRLLVADFDNGKIRSVDAAGEASTFYGGVPSFTRPFALARSDGALYVATDNDPAKGHGPMSGTLWTIDDAGHARIIAMRIGRPRGIAVLSDGRLAIADYMHHVIELVDPVTGVVSPFAGVWDAAGFADGLGAAARFDTPYAIVRRPDDTLIVVDQGNHRLRAITPDGEVTTLDPVFDRPQGLAITAAGDLYVSDLGTFQIFRLRGGARATIAGDGQAGYVDAEDPLAARFYGLEGIAVTQDGATLTWRMARGARSCRTTGSARSRCDADRAGALGFAPAHHPLAAGRAAPLGDDRRLTFWLMG